MPYFYIIDVACKVRRRNIYFLFYCIVIWGRKARRFLELLISLFSIRLSFANGLELVFLVRLIVCLGDMGEWRLVKHSFFNNIYSIGGARQLYMFTNVLICLHNFRSQILCIYKLLYPQWGFRIITE